MSLNSQIAEVMLEKGRAQAQGQVGAGQAWGSALSQIGQGLGSAIGSLPQIQEQAKDSADKQRARDARTAFSKAMKDVPSVKQNGLSLYDVGGIGKAMSDQGFGAEFAPAAQHLDTLNQSLINFQQGRLNLIKTGAQALQASGSDPMLTDDFLDHLKGNQVYSDATIDQWRNRIKDDPSAAQAIVSYLAGPPKLEKLGPDDTLVNTSNPTPQPVFTAPSKPGEGRIVVNGQIIGPDNQPVGAPIPKQATPLTAEEKALKEGQLREIDAKLNGTIPLSPKDTAELKIQRDRLNAEVQHWKDTDEGAPVLSEEAKRIAAQQWAMTGQMVPAGMGKAGTKMRADIMNEAAKIYEGLDLPSQMAAYNANKNSLNRVQGTLDNLSAFEKAAGKNLDAFIEIAKKLPDSGVPWANTPIRLLSDKMVGNQYLPAINAARQIATREVARVVNDPGLKGELTDSARKGVDAMMSGDITFAQLKEVAPVLRNDMANVHSSLSDQLKDIAGRIATTPGSSTPAQNSSPKPPDALLPGFKVDR